MFEKLVKENRIWDAHIVAKNAYNRNLSDRNAFERYFDFCLKIAQYPIEIENRTFFLREGETALTFFSENVEMNEEVFDFIVSCRKNIVSTADQIQDVDNKQEKQHLDAIQKTNGIILTKLALLKGKVFSAKTQKEFDTLLVEIEQKESGIAKDKLINEHQQLYNNLTKEFSMTVSLKMEEFARQENKAYNKRAVDDFKDAFNNFKSDEGKYIGSDNSLFTLVNKRLFAYDAAKLFNETLIYYNHVYSYIFSKLNDDGKYRLTQYSIEAEKIRNN
jgi:hypothetical protein